MSSLNKVMLIGNLGKDPETRFTGTGTAVCNFSIATTEKWKDKSGAKKEETEWHNIIAWSKQAELCQKFLKKGSPVFIEGKLKTRSWDDKEGNKRYTTEVVLNNVVFLGKAGDGGGQQSAPLPDQPHNVSNNAAPSGEGDGLTF